MTDGFKIIGLSIRTTNKNSEAQQALGKLWGQFFSENIIEKIPNKISDEIIAIYTDYISDYTDEYTAIIGIPVSNLDVVPEGLVGREFESDHFNKITAKGEMPMAVAKSWIEIWDNEKFLNRKYTYDFEVYGANSQKGIDSEVDIFIATHSV